MQPTPSLSKAILGFIDWALLHWKANELYKIPQLHHSYTTLYWERGRKAKKFVRNLQSVLTIIAQIVAS